MRKFLLHVKPVFIMCLVLLSAVAFGQGRMASSKKNVPEAAMEHIKKNKSKFGLSDSDITDLSVSNEYKSKHNGIKHVYVLQRHKGIEISGTLSNINMMEDGSILSMGSRLEKNVDNRINTETPGLSATQAIDAAARYLNLTIEGALSVVQAEEGEDKFTIFSDGGISLEPIPARLVYQPIEDGSLKLCWEVSIYETDAMNWWNLRLDATSGEVLDKDNMVLHCQFDNDGPEGSVLHREHSHIPLTEQNFSNMMANTHGVYNVFAIPVESPSHGGRTLVSGSAAHPLASPQGWHYNGVGFFTTTRGNNVYAYEDPNNNNNFNTNYSPNGGADLNFNYPLDLGLQPVAYRDAAITNLFYWNNVMHDVWYQYGFDEASGNFQLDNFGRGGSGSDPVLAEAQDSRNISTTRNNANFATPADGFAGRMQMYLWTSSADPDLFRVLDPAGIAGSYTAIEAAASMTIRLTPTPITGKLVLVNDGLANPEGCLARPVSNGADIAGNIAVVYRGTCSFAEKIARAQSFGAIAVVVINNAAGDPITMGGTVSPLLVPAVMISQANGVIIRNGINSGTVNVALKNSKPELDGDLDNGIIAHEYGHGISIRLTGGRTVTSCLNNAEQAGEGWSDWFGLMMTMRPGDTPGMKRGIGTYAANQPTDGRGIRPAPYSTDFTVNNYTYGRTNDPAVSAPHGIGFVFATALWDMTWALVEKYGFDSNLYSGTGGNNKAMQLVIDGLKLQVCRPGFLDSRDAILLADRINYGGANEELIWKVFAKRGFGFSASQGLNTSRFDQTEAFDLPPAYLCQTPLTITAVPSNNVFTGGIPTNIYLGYGPQSVTLQAGGDATNVYTWTPAAGLSTTSGANPVFTPTQPGVYTFTVKAVNQHQCTKFQSITIRVIDVQCGNNTAKDKVTMCSVGGSVICVSPNAVPGQLRAGATLGTCNALASLAANDAPKPTMSVANFPNPFNESTMITFTVAENGPVSLKVYDPRTGMEVTTLYNGYAETGEVYVREFRAPGGQSGLYIYKLITTTNIKSGIMVMQLDK